MTVENKTSKTEKLVMGSATYDFGFDVLLEDPTEEDAKRAIRCVVSDGSSESELEYGADYSVTLNEDGKGGVVTVIDPKNDNWTIIVYREYQEKQGSDYKDYNAFPAETLEQNLDKLTMILQQHAEELGRSVKVGLSSNVQPEVLVAHVERVYESVDNIDTVANDIENVNAVVANQENIDAVAANKTNINAVNANKANIDTVADNKDNIDIVAENIEGVNTTADNIQAILDAPTQAENAAASAQQAADTAAAFDTNAAEKTEAFNANATSKTNTFNSNASTKQSTFDTNASGKTSDFNTNATNKTATFDLNAENKTADFNTNASSKTTTFNQNAASKQAAVDSSATAAAQSEAAAAQSAQTATEKAAEAEYWAGQAATGQVQGDLAQTDDTKKDFIKNKRISLLENDAGYAKASDVDAALEEKADKSTTYSKTDVDNLIAVVRVSATVSTAWTAASGGGYTQEITIAGITASSTAQMELVQSATYATAQAEQIEYSKIYKAEAGAGKITLYADEPTTSTITINIIK